MTAAFLALAVTLSYQPCTGCPDPGDVLRGVDGVNTVSVSKMMRRAVIDFEDGDPARFVTAMRNAGYEASLVEVRDANGDLITGTAVVAGGAVVTTVGTVVAATATTACLTGVCAIGAGAAVVGGAGAIIGAILAKPVIAAALIVVGVGLLAYGGYRIYKGLTSESSCALPVEALPAQAAPETGWRRYMKSAWPF